MSSDLQLKEETMRQPILFLTSIIFNIHSGDGKSIPRKSEAVNILCCTKTRTIQNVPVIHMVYLRNIHKLGACSLNGNAAFN